MFKFLRKYSIWILGVGGSLLLIAFLAPNVITEFSRRAGYSGAVQATVGKDKESIGFAEWQKNVSEAQVVDRLGITVPGVGKVQSPEHWYLLSREADAAGLTPARQAVAIDELTLRNLSGTAGTSPQLILDTLAHLQGIQRLISLYQGSNRFSDRRLHDAADRLLSTVAIETVVIPAAAPTGARGWTDEELQTQLDAWSDVAPGDGDHGFGYRLPDRFTVEWIEIPTASIESAITSSDRFSSRQQRKFWRRNETDPRFPPVESGVDVPQIVQDEFLAELVSADRDAITRRSAERLRLPRRGVDEIGGFLVLPDDWANQKLPFPSLAESLHKEFGIDTPAYHERSEWTDVADADSIPAIGTATTSRLGDVPQQFGDLVAAAQEFGGNGIFPVQKAIAGPVLTDTEGTLYIFRIVDTVASDAPQSVAVVRDSLEADLNRLAHWEELKQTRDAIEGHARDTGLLQVAIEQGATVSRAQPVSRVDTGIPTILGPDQRLPLMSQQITQRVTAGQGIDDLSSILPGLIRSDPTVIAAIIDRAAHLPLQTPVGSLSAEDRVFVVPSEENLAMIVVRVTGTTPASLEMARALSGPLGPILQSLITLDELGGRDAVLGAFNYDTLAERHQFSR